MLDWELCTLGDPLADIGLLSVYWTGPDDEPTGLEVSPTTAPGFPGRDALMADYAQRTGRSVDDLAFYVALGHWKLACILQGVVTRIGHGAMGAQSDLAEVRSLAETVVRSAAAVARVAATIPELSAQRSSPARWLAAPVRTLAARPMNSRSTRICTVTNKRDS